MSRARRPLQVLVVDDHLDSLQIAALILRQAGHTPKTASTCADALGIARSVKIDVLITDLGLTDGDGCDLLREVRKMYPVRGVVLTGTKREDADQCKLVGVEAYLLKPIDMATLENTVASLA